MSLAEPIRILTLQAFYGGSHQQFIDGWIQHSRHRWNLLSLPARHWKWRMRHSAVDFGARIDELWEAGERWDIVLCTDMVNLAELKGVLKTDARSRPTVVYFHENQFVYPDIENKPRDLHFAFTNFTTALAADQVWFNSDFNRKSMLENLSNVARHWPDYQPLDAIESIACKAFVQSPGIATITPRVRNSKRPTHLVWAARWEYDKNPEDLLRILIALDSSGIEFQVSVIGQQFSTAPDSFEAIQDRFSNRILNWGYQECRQDYFEVLSTADVFLSTADHEFFGISAVEAIASGCIPILPNRLSYPEVLNVLEKPNRKLFLYETVEQAVDTIIRIAEQKIDRQIAIELSGEISDNYGWPRRADEMDSAIDRFIDEIQHVTS